MSVPPSSPSVGDTWRDPASGYLFNFVASADGGVWVQQPAFAVPSPAPGDRQQAPPRVAAAAAPTITDTPLCTMGAVPPTGPKPTDLWFDTIRGFLFIWYDDGTTAQWVVCNPGRGGLPPVPVT